MILSSVVKLNLRLVRSMTRSGSRDV